MATAHSRAGSTGRSAGDRAQSETVVRKAARYTFDGLVYAFLIAFAAITLLPLLWLISTAFKPNALVMQMPPELIPNPITLHNFVAFFRQMNVWRWILNSAIVVTAVTCGHVLFYSMAGYAFAKMNFPGRRILFWVVLATLTIPLQVIVVPLYKMMVDLAWVNTYWGLILPALVGPASLFLMKQFMSTLPSSLIDAARVDACSEWRIFWRIVVPLAKPAIAVMGIFTFMGFWNSFFWPLVVTQTREMRTLTVGLTMVRYAQFDYGTLMAGSVVAAIPMFVVFLAFQRYFLRGLTIGALKG
jgi:multiple sugar transport system permease protein